MKKETDNARVARNMVFLMKSIALERKRSVFLKKRKRFIRVLLIREFSRLWINTKSVANL